MWTDWSHRIVTHTFCQPSTLGKTWVAGKWFLLTRGPYLCSFAMGYEVSAPSAVQESCRNASSVALFELLRDRREVAISFLLELGRRAFAEGLQAHLLFLLDLQDLEVLCLLPRVRLVCTFCT